jgi:hypothetical protein
MTASLASDQLELAQSTELAASPPAEVRTEPVNASQLVWFSSTIFLFVMLLAVLAYGKWRLNKIGKDLNFEQYKTQDLKKKLKLALVTIRKLEMNPDLVYARGFNLDYLRLRMDEDVFHQVILNQIKVKVSQLVGELLRPSAAKTAVGIVGNARQIDSTFDVTYEVETEEGKWNKGVLFRVQVKLKKLPTQTSSATIAQICDCLENFLSPGIKPSNWQPSIQGHLILLNWDQKAKPTPLLILEQLEEGFNTAKPSQQSFRIRS